MRKLLVAGVGAWGFVQAWRAPTGRDVLVTIIGFAIVEIVIVCWSR